jgi:GDPmannose 4,6-dehydratase
MRILDALRATMGIGECRLLNVSITAASLPASRAAHPNLRQAGSSEMFGMAECLPITKQTPIRPRTPYGTSKASAYWIIQNYRAMYDMFAVTAILFNQESHRRRPCCPPNILVMGLKLTSTLQAPTPRLIS